MRRVSGNEFAGGSSWSRPQHDKVTPRVPYVMGKGQERHVTPLTVRTVGQKRLDNYSAFKGRGRYARGGDAGCDSIYPSFLSSYVVY